MAFNKHKIKYLKHGVKHLFNSLRRTCPSCGSSRTKVVSRKFGIFALRRCKSCAMLFRAPTTNMAENSSFYNEEYSEGFTTDCPSKEELSELLRNEFVGSAKDYAKAQKLDILASVGVKPGAKILDYGCSWGYGSWQLINAGYEVVAYEIGEARDQVGVNLKQIEDIEDGSFDCFFPTM